jgi:hypothetical protein
MLALHDLFNTPLYENFQDPHCEELNFPILFFGQPHSNQGIKMFYEMIAQWELLHKNHNFVTHIPILFF